ncbi:MAG: ABC transporter ATP-binding protein [Alphaproteobacteria bacterium]|nr:ABC transporter ATP-binding protein [Alphaproteobacteria bacterium]
MSDAAAISLAVAGVSKSFGGVRALADVSFALPGPGLYGLIGPNGAGKTTLFDVIAGRQIADAGRVLLDGRPVQGLRPHELAAVGLARTFQECRIFPEWTCLENLLFSLRPKGLAGALGRIVTRRATAAAEAIRDARRLLALATLDAYADMPASVLSFGQRRLLEIVAALMGRPRLLLLDEPAAGINPGLLGVLADLIRMLHAERGGLFLIVEHNMEFIMGLARHIVVMHQGAVLEEGPPAAIQASARVIEAYLG